MLCRLVVVGESLALDDVYQIILVALLLIKDTLSTVKHAVPRSSVADAPICRLLVFGRLALPLLQATG